MVAHAEPQQQLTLWLGFYQLNSPGVVAVGNVSVRLDLDNEVQPDALLLVRPTAGGQSRLSTDDYVEGAPELVGEVAASTVSYDLHLKLNIYRRNGVQEYLVWRVLDHAVDWFNLVEGEYRRLPASQAGVILPAASSLVSGSMFRRCWKAICLRS